MTATTPVAPPTSPDTTAPALTEPLPPHYPSCTCTLPRTVSQKAPQRLLSSPRVLPVIPHLAPVVLVMC